ncbi:MAG: heme-copper oxidase subunit III [Candidatus Sumerlaeota bacterium]|nr:heme-copper oxidase subunit III [Candidatus Sumerlaeota bacterium]
MKRPARAQRRTRPFAKAPSLSPAEMQRRTEMALLGMKVFLISLSILFTASLAGYLAVRARAAQWPPAGAPPLPKGLWASTIILLLSSGAMQRALAEARNAGSSHLRAWLATTLALGAAFLVSQVWNWRVLIAQQMTMRSSLYALTFYCLTALHGLHVIGGLVGLSLVLSRAFRGLYSPAFHLGVRLMAIYWHFLDVVWLVLFAAMFLMA